MRVRAARDLAQRNDARLFRDVAEGIIHCTRNSRGLFNQAQSLASADQKSFQGAKILKGCAVEEAAKALILVDAARCPKGRLSEHLKKFYDHLARILYAEACGWNATTYGQLLTYLESERHEFYLDGPNDVDWIFRNRAVQQREGSMYVDYAEVEDGEHEWICPAIEPSLFGPDLLVPRVLLVAEAFVGAGCATPDALAVVAGHWRAIAMQNNYSWHDLRSEMCNTFETLTQKGLLDQSGNQIPLLLDSWQFPLHQATLGEIKTSRERLREIQRNYQPAWLGDYY